METIIIQENDEATLEVVTAALQLEGYRVYRLDDCNENTLVQIRRYRPKLMLLDCWLSMHSGKEVSYWVKTHFPRLPVIAFSCDNRIDQDYRLWGFDDYLKKPFDLEELYTIIRRHLSPKIRQQPTERV